jgi:tetratricopeptide (TPR) repeat protein
MQGKPHILMLVAVVTAAVIAGAGCDKLRARDKLNKGVQAYKNAQFDQAIEDFKAAKEFDPSLTNAQLYLATAYATQYIPGAPSPENVKNGEQAIAEYKSILETDPTNLTAIDGMGSVLYNMGGTPFDEQKFQDSKSYHLKHIQLQPDNPESYYWVGVIDWSLAYHANKEMRDAFNKTSKKPVRESEPMPPALASQFAEKYGMTIDEGVSNLNTAIEKRPDYDDAMAYLNLLYRQKADSETVASARDEDLKNADDLVEKVKAIKQKKANISPNS